MAATRHAFLLALGIAVASPAAFLAAPARAQQEAPAAADEGNVRAQGEVANANFQFKGKAKSTVFVRSGPSNNFYPTMKLDKGAEVTVVGIKYEWLKIVPPPGSFSYVPKAYVERRGTGKIARVTNTLNVRAGSSENQIKTTVQLKLMEGQDVTILGEQDEYYKIVPPEGAYLFVHQQYIEPLGKGVKAKPEVPEPKPVDGALVAEAAEPATGDVGDVDGDQGAPPDVEPVTTADPVPGTQPAGDPPTAAADAPQVKSAAAAAVEEFDKLESDYAAASKQPVVDQPLERLIEGYTALTQAGTLTGQRKQIAQARLLALGMRADAREQLQAFRKGKAEMEERKRELETEKLEIDERIARTQVTLYSAVGLLRVSSLQQGPTTLYRLTDPGTGRTVVYLRSNDPKLPGLLNQFVGVRGDVVNDARLKMRTITPTATEPVDASKVNGTVIATIVPPSMLSTSAATDQGDAAAAE
jgi:SH3-like domain-containing protein